MTDAPGNLPAPDEAYQEPADVGFGGAAGSAFVFTDTLELDAATGFQAVDQIHSDGGGAYFAADPFGPHEAPSDDTLDADSGDGPYDSDADDERDTWQRDAEGNRFYVDAVGNMWFPDPDDPRAWYWNDPQGNTFARLPSGEDISLGPAITVDQDVWTSPDGRTQIEEINGHLFRTASDGNWVMYTGELAQRDPDAGMWHRVDKDAFDQAVLLNRLYEQIMSTEDGRARLDQWDNILDFAERAGELVTSAAVEAARLSGPWGRAAAFGIDALKTAEALQKATTLEQKVTILMDALAPGLPTLGHPAAADVARSNKALAIKTIDKHIEADEAYGRASAPDQLYGQFKVGPAYATREQAIANLPHDGAHLAQVTHSRDGRVISTWWEVSETGQPAQVGHTEQKALVRVDLQRGDQLVIRGYHPPCAFHTGCQMVMAHIATKTGAEIRYTGVSSLGNITEWLYLGRQGHILK
jgi:hypothetical protein